MQTVLPPRSRRLEGTTYAGKLVAGESLGDIFQLQMVGFDQVPQWATNLAEVNGVLSSEVAELNTCLQEQETCNGYRRLVIGRIGDGSDDEQQATNRTAVIVSATLGSFIGATIIVAVVFYIAVKIKNALRN